MRVGCMKRGEKVQGSESYNRKPIPQTVLVFGAAGRIGAPLAKTLANEAPSIRLRLATHSPQKAAMLREQFPSAEVVVADYFDPPSLRAAVEGMEGIFVITSSGIEERPAMTNLIAAVRQAGDVKQILRQVGLQPEANPARIPASLRDGVTALPIQHAIAKQLFDESGLPVTYLNCGATFMDNFILFGMNEYLKRDRRLIWPERLIPWIDTRDVGEVAARLFLSDNHRHIGQFHTLNNGHDLMRFHDVAALMSEVWGVPIVHDSSQESFFSSYLKFGERRQVLWDFFQYEQDNEVVWALNDFVERMLGRKPRTLREWLIEHHEQMLGLPE